MPKKCNISFKTCVSAIMLLTCSSCLVSNHEFIPLTAKMKAEPLVQGAGYAFTCYAPYYIEDQLIIEFTSDSQKNKMEIKAVVPYLPNKVDQPRVVLIKPYQYHFPGIKKEKSLTVLVEYVAAEGDSVTVKQTHELKKVRDWFFAIH